jgi:hypothetical protein
MTSKNPPDVEVQYNTEGAPLKLHELDIARYANYLCSLKIRTTQGKLLQPLHEGHLEVLNDPARFKVLACGRRWGKTLLTSLVAASVLMQPNRRVWIVAPDYNLAEKVFREVYSIFVTQMKIILPGKPGGGRARNQKGDYFLQTPWGSILEAKSMENADSLAGEANDLVIVDEAALDPRLEEIWFQMLRPTLMDKEGAAIFISTPRGKNSFYKMFMYGQIGRKQRDGKLEITNNEEGVSNSLVEWSSFQRTSYDNPLLAATPEKSKEEVDNAYRTAVLSGKGLKFKQEYLADFESVSDTCFPGFIEEATDRHPHANITDYVWHPDEGPVYAGCDHNYAKPAATVFAQVNKYGDVIVFDERFTRHTTSYMQAQQIMDKERELNGMAYETWNREMQVQSARHTVRFENIVADVSGKQVQLNGRSAWDDMESVLGRSPVGLKQDRETGCNMLRLWMQYPKFDPKGKPLLDAHGDPVTFPKLFINRNCVNLIYALSTAVFKKSKAGSLKEDYEETPEGYEGLLDALRYLLVHLFHDTGQHFTISQGF